MPPSSQSKGSRGGRKAAPRRPRAKAAESVEATAPPERTIAVRMIYGERVGQIVEVSVERAQELCNGPIQRAELVAVRPADRRQTRG